MSLVADRIEELGLTLPEPMQPPPGADFPFERVRIHAGLAYVSGHGPVDGTTTLTRGRVGDDVGTEEAAEAARQVALATLASLTEVLGDLDRIESWVRAFGMVCCTPDFDAMPAVINGYTGLINDVWGDAGRHSRSAIGVAALPFGWPVEVESVVAIRR
ncbi:MAG: RidA family protein [Solirubrobacterales bacterium]|nr:RidA family protein [Solirubrobacterales bacterium]